MSNEAVDPSRHFEKADPENANGSGESLVDSEETGSDSDATEAGAGSDLSVKLKEAENKYLYLYAEFENYKKRAVKDRSDLMKFGWEKVARELVGVLDNLERAVEAMPPTTDAALKTGIELVLSHFKSTVEKQGVAPVTSKGSIFNPEIHEAMGQEPSALPSGTVTQELTKGYTLHGRLLRPARVVISSGVAPT